MVLVGTKKGLFLLKSRDRRAWEILGPYLAGKEVNHAVYDARNGRIFATSNDAWFGSSIAYSDDLGETWTNAAGTPGFTEDSGRKLERLWHIEPGLASEPDVLYVGVAPAALFRSEDKGDTWTELPSVANHPTSDKWCPGAGGLCLHSIVVDRDNPQLLYIGISAAGVFRSEDGGETWAPANKGTRAEFLPDKYPEVGQCVHKVLSGSQGDGLLFQQNHCGVYRSEDGGRNWVEITAGLPSDFGFPLAVHPHQPQTIFVLPLQGAEFRCPPEGKLRVFHSRDGGDTWQASSAGLPQHAAYAGVYRECMCVDQLPQAGIYFGTNTGKVFCTDDEGESWNLAQDNLPPVFSLETAILD